MTKEDWKKVEKALQGSYGLAELQVDGRKVTFSREFVSKNTLGIVTYVDGHWVGAWLSASNNCPESRYLRPHFRYLHTAKERERLRKLAKWIRKDLGIDPDAGVHLFTLIWPSVTLIRRHYQKTFTSIELIEVVG